MPKNEKSNSKDKQGTHPTTIIDLDTDLRDIETKKTRWINYSSKSIVAQLKDFLDQVHEPKYCDNCGGILPDLCIGYRGTAYLLTCAKIEREGQVLKETDYVTLAGWVMAQHFNKKCLDGSLRDFLKKLLKENIEKFKADKERLPNLKATLSALEEQEKRSA